jgi:hypothetical protein
MMTGKQILAGFCTAGLLAMSAMLAGCSAVGAIAAKMEREGSRDVPAQYEGLGGKTFAVVVAADRAIQGDHPLLTELMIERMTQRLANNTNVPRAAGFVPPLQVQKYLVEHTNWTALSLTDLAKELGGVDRLVYVDLYEFRLNDPGNAYLWEGVAAGTVSVIETDSPVPDDFAFQKEIQVKFPDNAGMGPNELSSAAVRTELARRFIERACWLMYNHEEKNNLEY